MAAPAPDTPLLAELIAWQARVRPDAGAITFEGHTQTFAQLDDNACRVAQGLLADGFSPDARIATLT
ncbi:MAG TPA: AMP-binding protein, partial [Terricaulis sp.]|nr:AMP-binding protein [Terricaulis sp.]